MSRRSEKSSQPTEEEEEPETFEEETEESAASQVDKLQMIIIKKNLCLMINDRGYLLPPDEERYLNEEPEAFLNEEEPNFEMTYSNEEDENGNFIGKILRTTLLIKTDNKAINKQDATDLIKILRADKDISVNTFIIISNVKAHRLGNQKLSALMTPNQTVKGALKDLFIQFFKLEELLYDPTQHFYQSQFAPLTEDERLELDSDGITTAVLPVMKYSDLVDEVNEQSERRKNLFCDPIVRHFGWRTGDIIKEEANLFAVPFLNTAYLNYLIIRR